MWKSSYQWTMWSIKWELTLSPSCKGNTCLLERSGMNGTSGRRHCVRVRLCSGDHVVGLPCCSSALSAQWHSCRGNVPWLHNTGKRGQVPSGHPAEVSGAAGHGQWHRGLWGSVALALTMKALWGLWQVAGGIKREKLVLPESTECCEVCCVPPFTVCKELYEIH